MKTGNLVKLMIVAAIVCLLAIVAYYKKNATGPRKQENALQVGGALLPDLLQKAENVAAVSFAEKDGAVRVARDDKGEWKIETAGGYPASAKKIQQLVFELSDLKVADVLTDKKEKREALGLAGETGERGVVRLLGKEGNEIASVILGKERVAPEDAESSARGGGRFVLAGNDPHAYLVQESLYWVNSKVRSWVETEILSVPRESIVEAAIDHGSTESLRLVFQEGKLHLDRVAEGMQEKTYEVSSAAGALSGLRFEDVLPADSEEVKALDFLTTYTAKSKDGTVYTARAAEKGEKKYVSLSAVYDAPFFTDADKATTVSLAAAEEAAKKAGEAVPEFNKTHGPWVYEMAGWSFQNLAKKRSELMEPAVAPKKEGADEQSKTDNLEPATDSLKSKTDNGQAKTGNG